MRVPVRKVQYEMEVTVCCHGCKTFETLWFKGKTMVPTKKFSQRRDGIYHDCGAPCRLFRQQGGR